MDSLEQMENSKKAEKIGWKYSVKAMNNENELPAGDHFENLQDWETAIENKNANLPIQW